MANRSEQMSREMDALRAQKARANTLFGDRCPLKILSQFG